MRAPLLTYGMDDRRRGHHPRKAPPPGLVLTPEFFARPSDEVGPDLVGKVLWRAGVGGGRLTEVEAYLPTGDPACHAAIGRTPRNASMFGPPGCVYVYRSYGVQSPHTLCVTREVGSPVLVRSFEPLNDAEPLRQESRDRCVAIPEPCPAGGTRRQALGLRLDLDGLPLGEESGCCMTRGAPGGGGGHSSRDLAGG